MLDYKLLDALAHVVWEGGFDRAAKALHITQSAVSQRIRLLEDLTGMVLLTRTLPPSPTPGGTALIKHYIQVRHLEEDLKAGIEATASQGFRTLALGINADSLSTWFYPAVQDFLTAHPVLLDLRVDDQDQTHQLLRNGEVLGCISSEKEPVQGCRAAFIGTMAYRMVAAPKFRSTHFPAGLTLDRALQAPAVIYNHKDDLHARFLTSRFQALPSLPAHYIPSPEQFVAMILSGQAYGMVPDLQSRPWMETGALVDLDPGRQLEVSLFWHRWNIGSSLLDEFSRAIVKNAVIC